jgi:hypothetical protein
MLLALMLAAAVSPSPKPTATPAHHRSPAVRKLRTIGHVVAHGRDVNLVGKVSAASSGTIDAEQIATRPVLRPAEILEAIPGLLISQHSGEGKANQYYLRGFQLDHGTDLEATIAGTPINLPTHAHGQGYSDINWLIPELVSYVDYHKGTYYADTGDFSTAGSYALYYKSVLDAPIEEVGIGSYGYGNVLLAGSPKVGVGNLLYAFQIYHDNGSFERPDEYAKFNGVLKWSRSTPNSDFGVTAMGYHGTFQSSDQIPQRLVADGQLSPYVLIDPYDGGTTYRYSLAGEYRETDARGETQANVFGFAQYLDLYSDFTYDLDDATDYYNVTRSPVRSRTRPARPTQSTSPITCRIVRPTTCPVPGTTRRTRSYRCRLRLLAAINASKPIGASSRAAIFRARLRPMAGSSRRPDWAFETTISPRSACF